MNPQMKQRIDEKLDQLSDQYGAQILDFAEFLASKESRLDAEEANYLAGVQGGLSEWSSAADEDAYRDL
ncbi:MAG: hypothetical protein PHV02_13175 [Rhodocyclaceae bacterium]|nr:hypothetical protein [Rhodocyclaceae bacterium]